MASRAKKKRLAKQKGGRVPILLGLDHPLFDPTEHPYEDAWCPANAEAELLIVCLEACKGIVHQSRALNTENPGKDRVGLHALVTPLVSLADRALQLRSLMGRNRAGASRMNPEDAENLVTIGRRLSRAKDGPLWQIRNQRSAHHDPNFSRGVRTVPATLDLILPVMADALLVLAYLARHDGFKWRRLPNPKAPTVREEMVDGHPLAVTYRVDPEDRLVGFCGLTMTPDPVLMTSPTLQAMEDTFNYLAQIHYGQGDSVIL